MCYSCYEEAGCPVIINDNVKYVAEEIEKFYELPECGAGGYGHIVFDDWNIEDANIDYCIESAIKKEWKDHPELSRLVCLELLRLFKKLSMEERHTAMALYSGFINK